MALTRIDHTGDGTTTQYDITFDLGYLREEFVYVYLDGNDFTDQLGYTWVNSTRIQLNTPVANGELFHIRRVIPRDAPVNDYQEGAILREDNLDDSFVQSIMILQEITDGYLTPTGDVLMDSNLDMLGHYIKNLAEGVNPQDAVNLAQLQAAVATINNSISERVLRSGDTMTGQLNTLYPETGSNAANAEYVDAQIAKIEGAEGVVPLIQPRQQGDGTTTTFPSPATGQVPNNSLLVNIDGVTQRPLTDYTANAVGQVVFNEAPALNADIDITLFEPVNLQEAADFSQVTATGSTTPRTLGDRFADVVNVRDYGAVGDGIVDDTAAIQAALNTGASDILIPNGVYNISSTLTIVGDTTVITNLGELSFIAPFDGDSGLYALNKSKVTVIGGKITNNTVEASRTALHRAIRMETCGTVKVEDVELQYWYTNVHAIKCTTLYATRVRMLDTYGKDPQYGYGINSSAETAFITDCFWWNTLSTTEHGRHALYINGTAEHVFVKGFIAKGCARNPINIALENTSSGIVKFDGIDLQDCNLDPTSPTAGCINASEATGSTSPETMLLSIDGLRVRNYAGMVLSIPEAGWHHGRVINVSARGYVRGGAVQASTALYFRNTEGWTVDNVFVESVEDANSRAVQFRESNYCHARNIRLTGSLGQSCVRFDDARFCTAENIVTNVGLDVYYINDTTGSRYIDPNQLVAEILDVSSINALTIGNKTSVRLKTGLTSSSIGSIVGSYDGQLVTITNGSGSTVTLLHNTPSAGVEELWLTTRADTTLRDDDAITFVKAGSRWIQVQLS